MAKSGHGSSPPPSTSRLGGAPSKIQPLAAIHAEAQKAADEMVVDDYVDAYLFERPRTRDDLAAVVVPGPPSLPRQHEAPAQPALRSEGRPWYGGPAGPRDRQADRPTVRPGEVELAHHGDEHAQVEEVDELEGDVVVLEAELADRDERISSLEGEVARLRRAGHRGPSGAPGRSASAPAPSAAAPLAPPGLAAPALERGDPREEPAPGAPPARGPARTIVGVVLGALAAASLVAGLVHRADRRKDQEDGRATPATAVTTAPAATAAPATAAPPTAAPATAPPPTVPDAIPPAATAPVATAAPMVAEPAATAPGIATPTPGPAISGDPAPAEGPAHAVVEDAEGLLSFQGHLTVRSSASAEVVVQGHPVGRTNERILARCGPRNVRLRREGEWVTAGEHVRIVCMKHTTVRLEPSP